MNILGSQDDECVLEMVGLRGHSLLRIIFLVGHQQEVTSGPIGVGNLHFISENLIYILLYANL